MGVSRMNFFLAVVTISSYLLYNYGPRLDIEPQGYNPLLMKLEGPLAINQALNKGQRLLTDIVHGPESLAYKDGLIYASVMDGRIVSIQDEKIVKTVADTTDGSKVPSHPLGLRFHDEDLYVADAKRGLLKVDVKTGKVSVLVPKGEKVGKTVLHFLNDLDIVNGEIYFSDVTTKWNCSLMWYGVIEHGNTGRVFKYNIATGKSEVVLDKLYYPNGIQSTPDKKSILIAELLNYRILRHYISGPKKGQTEIFVQLPGEPDNIRTSSGGGYWVPLIASRDISSPSWADTLAPYPTVVKALCKLIHALGTGLEWTNQYISSAKMAVISSELKSGHWVQSFMNMNHPIVIELSAEGEVLRSFHSDKEEFSKFSQGLELNGHLFLGSFENSQIVKIKL